MLFAKERRFLAGGALQCGDGIQEIMLQSYSVFETGITYSCILDCIVDQMRESVL